MKRDAQRITTLVVCPPGVHPGIGGCRRVARETGSGLGVAPVGEELREPISDTAVVVGHGRISILIPTSSLLLHPRVRRPSRYSTAACPDARGTITCAPPRPPVSATARTAS